MTTCTHTHARLTTISVSPSSWGWQSFHQRSAWLAKSIQPWEKKQTTWTRRLRWQRAFIHPLSYFHLLIDETQRYPQGIVCGVCVGGWGLQVVWGCISSCAEWRFLDFTHVLHGDWKETGGGVQRVWRGGIVINTTDADLCNTSGKCSHFQKSPKFSEKSLQASEIILNLVFFFSCFLTICLFLFFASCIIYLASFSFP